jgi:hypothetical protein
MKRFKEPCSYIEEKILKQLAIEGAISEND